MLEKLLEGCLPWEGPYTGAGEECEEEGVAERTSDELTPTPIPHPPVPLGGEDVEKIASKVKPGKKQGVEGRCFKIF